MTGLLDWIARAEIEDTGRGIHLADRDDWTLWSYPKLAGLTRTLAAGLRDRGVDPGDVVVIVARSGPGFVAAFFGALLAGATPAPVPPRAPFRTADTYDDHLAALLRLAQPAAVLTDADLLELLRPVVAAAASCLSIDDLLAAPTSASVTVSGAAAKPPALLQFTSGSTGNPRGIRVPHDALAANIAAIRTWLHWRPEDACASWLPVHHDMGLIGCLLTPIVTGADLWLMAPEHFITRPERYLRCFGPGGARLTAMPTFGLSHILRRLRDQSFTAHLAATDLSGWRAAVIGAERVYPAVLDEFESALAPFGLRPGTLLPAYGLAEATLAATGVPLGRARREFRADPATLTVGEQVRAAPDGSRIAGCGAPLDDTRVTVTGADGRELPERHVGEIVVRGPAVAAGYVSAASTASTTRLDDGTLKTGDAGFIDGGELFVIGRLGDALKVRGRLVYAEDLEAALGAAGLPLARLAVALGSHHGNPTAVAVLEDATPQRAEASARILRAAAGGAEVIVVAAESGTIPRTTSGKPRRRALWQWFVFRQTAS